MFTNRIAIYRAILEGKKLTHASFPAGKFIKLNNDGTGMVDQDNQVYDTTFKTVAEWKVFVPFVKRNATMFRHAYKLNGAIKYDYTDKSWDTFKTTVPSATFLRTEVLGPVTVEDYAA